MSLPLFSVHLAPEQLFRVCQTVALHPQSYLFLDPNKRQGRHGQQNMVTTDHKLWITSVPLGGRFQSLAFFN